jgi:hypothetical protein
MARIRADRFDSAITKRVHTRPPAGVAHRFSKSGVEVRVLPDAAGHVRVSVCNLNVAPPGA